MQVHTETVAHREALIPFIETELGGVLSEAHLGTAKFSLQKLGLTLASAFRTMENAKARLGIKEYGLSQPSLEQVFMNVVGDRINAV